MPLSLDWSTDLAMAPGCLQHSRKSIDDSLITSSAHLLVGYLGHAGCKGFINAGRLKHDDTPEVLPEHLPEATEEELMSI